MEDLVMKRAAADLGLTMLPGSPADFGEVSMLDPPLAGHLDGGLCRR